MLAFDLGAESVRAIVIEGKTRPEILDEESYKYLLYESRNMLRGQVA